MVIYSPSGALAGIMAPRERAAMLRSNVEVVRNCMMAIEISVGGTLIELLMDMSKDWEESCR